MFLSVKRGVESGGESLPHGLFNKNIYQVLCWQAISFLLFKILSARGNFSTQRTATWSCVVTCSFPEAMVTEKMFFDKPCVYQEYCQLWELAASSKEETLVGSLRMMGEVIAAPCLQNHTVCIIFRCAENFASFSFTILYTTTAQLRENIAHTKIWTMVCGMRICFFMNSKHWHIQLDRQTDWMTGNGLIVLV